MRIGIFLSTISIMFVSLQAYAKTVHLVGGPTSGRTLLDLHPLKRTAVLNVEYTGCDTSFNPAEDRKNVRFYKPKCMDDNSSNPSTIKGKTLSLTVDYVNKNVAETCAKKDMVKKRITIVEDLNKPAFKKAIEQCGAQNITVQGVSDTKKNLGAKNKARHKRRNTRALGTAQTCDILDQFKKIKFGDSNGISPEKGKDPILQKGIYVRNGGFRIGNHTYAEYNAKKSQWCLKTYQPSTIKKRVTREEVINTGTCGIKTRSSDLTTPMPLQITSREKNGDLTVRGSMTLHANGQVQIGAIEPLKVNLKAIRQQAANEVIKTHKNIKSKAFKKAFVHKVQSLYNKKMKAELTYDRLRKFDYSKGSLTMNFKEHNQGKGHRVSVITSYDKNGKHLRSIQMNPRKVVGNQLNDSKAWCSGENCLLMSKGRRVGKKIDGIASCGKIRKKHLDMAGGSNTCMSCFGITPGTCKNTPETIDNAFAANDISKKDRVFGHQDPLENIIKKHSIERKGKQCNRAASPLPTDNTKVANDTNFQPNLSVH